MRSSPVALAPEALPRLALITLFATLTVGGACERRTGAPQDPASAFVECGAPRSGWIWCDDFEVDRLSAYYEYASAGGKFVRAAGVGRDGSYGMRARFAAGDVNAGALHLAFGKTPGSYFDPVDAGTALYRDIYWRVYFRNQAGWVPSGENEKLTRGLIFAGTNFSNAAFAHLWSGSGTSAPYLILDPASGTDVAGNLVTTQYNDFANMRWLGISRGTTPVLATSAAGVWRCVEVHAQLNDAGLANGIFEFWIDGALEARRAGLNWVGTYSAFAWNAVFLENYINAGAPQAQQRDLDDFVVSTQRIGC
ncbi:MAG: hypothetical protein ACREME_01785 [Gemmatimonadales bacterium]